MASGIHAVKFTQAQQQRYRQIGQLAAYDDPELGPILREAERSRIETSQGEEPWVTEKWRPTMSLKFIKTKDGKTILHQLWESTHGNAEWRQVPLETET